MREIAYSTPLVPRQVRIELTSKCNAHCLPCHRNLMKRAPEHMLFSLLEKCLEDIRAFPEPLLELVPTGWGELFLYPRWLDALELISQKLPGTRIVLPTNGTLLGDGSIEHLARIPTLRLVNFSVNAFFPETYTAFHKLPASKLELIEFAARRLKELRPDIVMWFSMVRSSEFQSPLEAELFREKWSKYGVPQFSQAEYAGNPEHRPIVPVLLPCRSLFSDLVILYDGQGLSCCYVAEPDPELVVGDAREDSLLNIWNSKRFSELRRVHNEGGRANLGFCSSCTFA